MLKANLERRSYHRMLIDSPVQITDEQQNVTAICRDLSASGMSLDISDSYFSLNDNVSIFLPTGDTRVPPLQAEAKVTRIEHSSDVYQIGVEFINFT
ncbi:PilZ domain-containing protein [Moritella sp. 24]|uniref:PilZ domain-containing protein n=1 Tax=Moritella sp. 24 TaxID=2746230 RepID=UPI001BA44212|nr:PilZ domain-containing protein [Moritella sp. 24]QUM75290.1 PilZ domain-containing protein [Moritella sp. 24]